MISFFNSSSEYPIASFAAILAIGKPVAFEASADDLETLGFISITTILPFFGLTANCTLAPPVSTPISLITWIAWFLIFWNSLSVKVKDGATVIESPVWTPMGSTFSIEQTIIQLSFLSLITSISNSFQPSKDSSIKISFIGDRLIPFLTIFINSLLFLAVPPPEPPSVKDGLMMIGKDKDFWNFKAFFKLLTTKPLGESSPIFVIDFLNNSLFSAFSITDFVAPMSSTLYLDKIFFFCSSIERFKAVWPPMVESKASGFSLEIIFSRK